MTPMNAGVAIGVNHPNSSYGLFLADDDHTVPGGMSEDFDGIEVQGFSASTINEAFGFWNAYPVRRHPPWGDGEEAPLHPCFH